MKTRRRATISDFAGLPQELITQILLRLPAKSIGRFRCVSKPWNSLLSSPNFIKSHLTLQSIHNPQNLIIISSSDHSLFTLNFNLKSSSNSSSRRREDGVSRKLKNCRGKWNCLLGSCNGLVLVLDYKNCMFLMNPTTLEIVKVSYFSLALDLLASFSLSGFGYDSSSDDYKFVKLECFDQPGGGKRTLVNVYSLKTKTWRRSENSLFDHISPRELCPGVFLNGAIHWLATDSSTEGSPVVVFFDLSTEKFNQVVPSCFNKSTGSYAYKLVVLGGYLGMVCDVIHENSQFSDHICIWLMKEYGVQESWTKLVVNMPQNAELFKPICQFGDDEVVFMENGAKLVLHNLKEKSSMNMVVHGTPRMYYDGIMTFTESLVSPSFCS
ncbi:hypothetical protein ACH5RR_033475 [Cinchona calisaya]|uniref:F-box domain-containing protein n=1 Tax=Cinchona calisaya TaxID=153742 RepID=A0ABD2YL24_9GENT